MPQLESSALTVGMRAKDEDGRDLLRVLDEQFGSRSTTQTAKQLIDFMKQRMKHGDKISMHNNTWLDQQRRIDEGNGFDKETMQVVLYLLALGPKYRMFVNLACMYSKDQFTLKNVMDKAKDFQVNDGDDEADTGTIALMAKDKANGTARHDGNGKCSGCGSQWHTWKECFDGGLAHLDREGRRKWLDARRHERGNHKEKRGRDDHHHGGDDTGRPYERDRSYGRDTRRGEYGRDYKRGRRSPSPQPRQENAHMALQHENLQLKIQAAKDKLAREGITIDLGL